MRVVRRGTHVAPSRTRPDGDAGPVGGSRSRVSFTRRGFSAQNARMTDAPTGRDAREHFRAPIELKVEYKKMNTFFSDYTKNISKGGTFIKTDKPLKVGTEFVFKLFVPAQDDPFTLRGQVAWINTEHESQRPEIQERGMGIRFLYTDDAQREKFEALVEDMMKSALGDVVYKKLLEKTR
jgi:type IV pilus assembly protein PilZ